MARSFKTYRALVALLRKNLPPAYPIRVRRAKLNKSIEGRCLKYDKRFVIEIAKDLGEDRAIDILLHEWAHARAWNHMLDTAPTDEALYKLAHDAAWGVAYSEVYTMYERHFTVGIT
jgi:hypothetical protein